MSDSLQSLLKIVLAIIKYRLSKEVGDEALQLLSADLVDISGEQLWAKIGAIFTSVEGAKQLIEVARQADECFRAKCSDPDLVGVFTMPFGDQPTIQDAITNLPKSLDETVLINALQETLKRDFPKLTSQQVDVAVDLYAGCLRQCLLPAKEYTLSIIGQTALRTEMKIDVLTNEQRKEFAQLRDVIRAAAISIRENDELDNDQKAILLEIYEKGKGNTAIGAVRIDVLQIAKKFSKTELKQLCIYMENEDLIKHFGDNGERFTITHKGLKLAKQLQARAGNTPEHTAVAQPKLFLKLFDVHRSQITENLMLYARHRELYEIGPQKLKFGIQLQNLSSSETARNIKIRISAFAESVIPAFSFGFSTGGITTNKWVLNPNVNNGRSPAKLEYQGDESQRCYPEDYVEWPDFWLEMITGGTVKIRFEYQIWWDGIQGTQKGNLWLEVTKPENTARCVCCKCYWLLNDGDLFKPGPDMGRTGWICNVCVNRGCRNSPNHLLSAQGEY